MSLQTLSRTLKRFANGDETDFSLTLVSPQFEGMTTIKRHRTVNSLLKEQFDGGLHALSLNLKTPAEWEKDERTR